MFGNAGFRSLGDGSIFDSLVLRLRQIRVLLHLHVRCSHPHRTGGVDRRVGRISPVVKRLRADFLNIVVGYMP